MTDKIHGHVTFPAIPAAVALRYRNGVLRAWLVLLVMMGSTAWVWIEARDDVERNARRIFDLRAQEVAAKLSSHMQDYEQVLRGAVALFAASAKVSRVDWRNYVATTRVRENRPGIERVLFSRYVTQAQKSSLEKQVQAEGYADFRIHPPGDREAYLPVIYLEPLFNGEQQQGLGFDLLSEPAQYNALEMARDSGKAVITGKLSVANGRGGDRVPGFNIHLPVYDSNAATNNAGQRRRALTGYVSGTFRVPDFMLGVFGDGLDLVGIALFDGIDATGESLLYISPSLTERSIAPGYSKYIVMETLGHAWTLQVYSKPEFEATIDPWKPRLIGSFGVIVTLLSFMLLLALARSRRNADELRASNSFNAAIIESAGDGLTVYDNELRYRVWNRFMETITDIPADQVLGHSAPELFPRLRDIGVLDCLERALRGETAEMTDHPYQVPSTGRLGWTSRVYVPYRDARGAVIGVIGVIHDVTARRQAEAELRNSEIRLRTLIAESPIGISISRGDVRIYANNTLAAIYGLPDASSLIGVSIMDGLNAEQQAVLRERATERLQGNPVSPVWTYELVRAGGERRTISVRAVYIRLEGDALTVRFVTDITEQVASEAQIRKLNQELEQRVLDRTAELETTNRELSAFAYSVSHDLRSPLRAVDGFSHALLVDHAAQLDEVGLDYLTRICGATRRMSQLIDDLLMLSRITRQELHLEQVDLAKIAAEVVGELRQANSAQLVSIAIDPVLTAAADPNLMRIVLTNLLHNSWKFSARTGAPHIEFGRMPGNPQAFYVRDNGAGFSMEFASKLFQPFQRLHGVTEFEGTGIGLATVSRIIERHGGKIWAESAVDQGAAFYFTLGP
jgi:PAS domain S-box-containing protein